MERQRVRHLPVVEGGRVIGIISGRMLLGRRTEYLNRQVEERTRELKRANDELMARDADLRYHLRAAGRLQTRLLLPKAPPDWPELRWGLHYMPLDHLGGDYYDVACPDPDHLGFLIADASGHSIAAGMVAIMSRIAFAEVAGSTTSPGVVLTEMNRRLQGLADERFVTAFYAVLNRRTRVMTYANAGHPYPLRRVGATGRVEPISAPGFMLGIMPDEQYRERTLQLEAGDRVCFYTDGLIEARNEIGETFGTDRLLRCVNHHGACPAPALAEHILHCQRLFQGAFPPTDDLTLVVAELREPA
jgi:serine phosphatase RsbU (regulator of sigma subunit)